MATSQIEYVGFRSGETTRDYRLLVRHPDGEREEFTLTIEQEAFLSRRVRYQDAAEICFLKLRRAVDALASAPESGPLAAKQKVTEADLLEYREVHAVKPRASRPPRPH